MANSAGLHMYGLSDIDWKGKTNSQLAAEAGNAMPDGRTHRRHARPRPALAQTGRRAPVDISQMARRVFTDLSERDPEHTVTWDSARDLRADADPVLIQSVFDNLLGNAWKFSRRVDAAHIKVYSEQRDGHTWFVVEDNGAGFDMAYADKLFKPFQRLHSPRELDGTGVGLATVHRIITRHGSRIEAESVETQGARFRFSPGQ